MDKAKGCPGRKEFTMYHKNYTQLETEISSIDKSKRPRKAKVRKEDASLPRKPSWFYVDMLKKKGQDYMQGWGMRAEIEVQIMQDPYILTKK